MKLLKMNLADTGNFSKEFVEYLNNPSLSKFYHLPPKVESFKKQMESKKFDIAKRELLVNKLHQQYADVRCSAFVENNITSLLADNTFTITTGHQLNIFTGPLYFIYKIVTAINASKSLKEHYPNHNFVPVYWMATEDHDFEEINHFHLFQDTLRWETAQKGAVGRMNTEGMANIIDKIESCPLFFKEAYLNGHSLSQATRLFVNELFGDHGLVIIDADDSDFKASFTQQILDDVKSHTAFNLVNHTSTELNNLGFKTQINAREINFFYLEDGLRERITLENGVYKVLNTSHSFTPYELEKLVKSHPERFSPNVVLRPLYQEIILPNLAYIGGPAEVVYWLQLKAVFDHYQIAFPILMPRNFALYVTKTNSRKVEKLGLTIEELFQDSNSLKHQLLSRQSEKEYSLTSEMEGFEKLFMSISQKAAAIDKSLVGMVGSEGAKLAKAIEQLEKRLQKSEEKNHETAINQLEQIKSKLFPGGGLQERHDNFLQFYVGNPDFINTLIDQFDAFDYRFNVLMEDHE